TPVRSGFARTWTDGKKIVDGPAELYGCTVDGLLAGEAATANTSGTAAWPTMLPALLLNSVNWQGYVQKSANVCVAPENRVTWMSQTQKFPVAALHCTSIDFSGSSPAPKV